MSLTRNRTPRMVPVIATVIAASAASAARAAESVDYQKLLTDKTPAMVTIKFVLKVNMAEPKRPAYAIIRIFDARCELPKSVYSDQDDPG